MLHICRATHVLSVIWNAEYDGGIHFRFDPSIGQYKVKLGQKRPDFQDQNLLLKIFLSYPILSQDSKNATYF